MTNIEQQFFKTFGIEARARSKEVRGGLIECGLYYPKITAEILLELICTLSQKDNNYIVLEQQKSVEELKEYIIQTTIENKYRVDIYKIRALFGGEEE